MLVLPRAVAVWGREVIDPDGDGTAVPIGKYKGLLAIAPLGVHVPVRAAVAYHV